MVASTLKRQTARIEDIHYSVIIPAYNEESFLPKTLINLKSAMASIPQQGEIIVVDNASTDNTAEIAGQYGARIVFEPFRQIARARNSGARAARSAFLVFLDADTILPASLLKQSLRLLTNKSHCGGGTLLSFDSKLPFLAEKLVKFWNWLSRTNKLAAGSFIFCLTQGFFEAGGFNEKIFAGEEIYLSRKLKRWGRRHDLLFTIFEDQPVITSGRKFHWYSSLQIVILLLLFTFFPYALRSRWFCRFWYNRPVKS
jgi:glycosyltransferase involved in cell wall biosynthesis